MRVRLVHRLNGLRKMRTRGMQKRRRGVGREVGEIRHAAGDEFGDLRLNAADDIRVPHATLVRVGLLHGRAKAEGDSVRRCTSIWVCISESFGS